MTCTIPVIRHSVPVDKNAWAMTWRGTKLRGYVQGLSTVKFDIPVVLPDDKEERWAWLKAAASNHIPPPAGVPNLIGLRVGKVVVMAFLSGEHMQNKETGREMVVTRWVVACDCGDLFVRNHDVLLCMMGSKDRELFSCPTCHAVRLDLDRIHARYKELKVLGRAIKKEAKREAESKAMKEANKRGVRYIPVLSEPALKRAGTANVEKFYQRYGRSGVA